MPNIIDLSTLFGDGDKQEPDNPVDLSGKPIPEDVRVILNSNVEVRCDIKYDGISPTDGNRRYFVVAELDWENYWPAIMIVGLYPSDVTLALKCADDMDLNTEGWRRAQSLQVIVEKQVDV